MDNKEKYLWINGARTRTFVGFYLPKKKKKHSVDRNTFIFTQSAETQNEKKNAKVRVARDVPPIFVHIFMDGRQLKMLQNCERLAIRPVMLDICRQNVFLWKALLMPFSEN